MVKTKAAEVEMRDNGIVYLNFPDPGLEINKEMALEILHARISFSPPGTKQLVLVDLSTNPKPDKEARDIAKSEEMVHATKALALIGNNSFSRILGNLFLGFSKGNFPVKLFSTEEEATEWLLNVE